MPRDALIAITGGLISAIAGLAFLGGSVFALIFVYLAPVPILLVGLSKGPKAATIAAGTGFLATGAFGGMLMAGLYGLVYALPAWMITRSVMLQRPSGPGDNADDQMDAEWYPIGPALTGLAMLATGFILLGHFNAGELGLNIDQAIAFEKRHGRKFNVLFKPGLIYEHIDLKFSVPLPLGTFYKP